MPTESAPLARMLDSTVMNTYVELEMDHLLTSLNWLGAARLIANCPHATFEWLPQSWVRACLHAPLEVAQAVIHHAESTPSMYRGIADVFEAWSKWDDDDLKKPEQRCRRLTIVQTVLDHRIDLVEIETFTICKRSGFAHALRWKDPDVLNLMFQHPHLSGRLNAQSFETVNAERWGGPSTGERMEINLQYLAILMNDRDITATLLNHGVQFDQDHHPLLGTPLDMAHRGQASEFLVAYDEHHLQHAAHESSLAPSTKVSPHRARL